VWRCKPAKAWEILSVRVNQEFWNLSMCTEAEIHQFDLQLICKVILAEFNSQLIFRFNSDNFPKWKSFALESYIKPPIFQIISGLERTKIYKTGNRPRSPFDMRFFNFSKTVLRKQIGALAHAQSSVRRSVILTSAKFFPSCQPH